MKVTVSRAVVGQASGVHWGEIQGMPVMRVIGGGVDVCVIMTPSEAKDHGASACYIAIVAALGAPQPGDTLTEPSLLVDSSGLPIGGAG